MNQENQNLWEKQLNKIIDEEVRACLLAGPTDLETVAEKVEARASVLINKLSKALAYQHVRERIRRKLKRTQVLPCDLEGEARQMAFEEMDEFRGIPPAVTYEDKPGHVVYISYLDTRELERAAALALLYRSITYDQKAYLALHSGNEFASRLAQTYGDLPLWDLYQRYQANTAARRQPS
jgi:hypothetical protein